MAAPGSHIGLNITATNNMKVLQRQGIEAEVWPTQTVNELRSRLAADWRGRGQTRPITHVVISAPGWIHPTHLGELAGIWPNIEFTVLNHSDIPYFCIDKFGTRNNRMLLDLFLHTHNIRVAANNPRVSRSMTENFGRHVSLLTNLYDCATFVEPVEHRRNPDPVRIGSFGAGRPWKNQLAAAYAAIPIARRTNNAFLEYYVNTRRPDGGERIIESRDELFHDFPGTKLVEVPWSPWPRFRSIVRTMDLLISPSFTETFCVVAADGIAEGTPSVVGPAMEWTPRGWQCDPHDPESIIDVGMRLLHDQNAVDDGRRYLRQYVHRGIDLWIRYLTGQSEVRS